MCRNIFDSVGKVIVMAKDGYKKGPWGTVTKIVFSKNMMGHF